MLANKQKQCLRIIMKSKYNAHSEPLFYKSQILPLEDLILQQKLLLMHSLVHGYSAVSFPQFISNQTANVHRYTFRDDNDFHVPRTTQSLVQKMPLIDFPSSWNSLDPSLKEISSKYGFKKILKQELLDKYSNFRCNRSICISCIDI